MLRTEMACLKKVSCSDRPDIAPSTEEAVTTEEAEEVHEMSFKSEALMRDTAAAVHRATTNLSPTVRAAALQSAEAMARECPLLVLQTWLDQFARVNGGTSPQDYVAANRVNLLNSLSAIVDCVVDQLDDTHPGQKSAIERIVSLAAEEMTRHSDIIPTVQVELGRHEMSIVVGERNRFLAETPKPKQGPREKLKFRTKPK